RRREGAGRRVHRPGPHPPGGLIPYARLAARIGREQGRPAHRERTPITSTSAEQAPRPPPPPNRPPRGAKAGPRGRATTPSRPRAAPARVPAPCIPTCRAARTPQHRPDRPQSARQGADPGRDARPGITGVLSRCAGHPTPPSPCVFTQVREGQRFQGRPATPPGRRGNGDPPPP